MIAVDTSALMAIMLEEPEADAFKAAMHDDSVLIGWPTLFELRIVLAGKGFANPGSIVSKLAGAPNVTPLPFDEKHYWEAERAFDRFGKSRHPAGLNMGDCFAYAVARIAKASLLFKGRDFGQSDIRCDPRSAMS